MADRHDLIRQVRTAVMDPDPPPVGVRVSVLYEDQTYIDALFFALNKLNLDLRHLVDFRPLPPWTIELIPQPLTFLLIKLATIQMLQLRAGEGAADLTARGIASRDNNVQEIEMPDLRVKEHDQPAAGFDVYGPGYWRLMWDRLQKEYDGEIARLVSTESPTKGPIQTGVLTRVRNSTGAVVSRIMDRGLPPTSLVASYVRGTLTLVWEPVYDPTFLNYKVVHKAPGEDPVTLSTPYDNHTAEFVLETTLVPGQHSFWVSGINRNRIETMSNIVMLSIV